MGTETTVEPLSDLQLAVLEFERLRFPSPGRKEGEILRLFGFQATRYYAILNQVIDLPAAEVYDAQHVRRLQRVRDRRRDHRRTAAESTPVQLGRWAAPRTP